MCTSSFSIKTHIHYMILYSLLQCIPVKSKRLFKLEKNNDEGKSQQKGKK